MAWSSPDDDILVSPGAEANLLSYTAEEGVSAGQVVEHGAAEESVEPSDADGAAVLGVAVQDATAGEEVTVARDGTKVRCVAGAAVTVGSPVASHGATGDEGEIADHATGDQTLGVAVTGGSAGDTVKVEINLGAGGASA